MWLMKLDAECGIRFSFRQNAINIHVKPQLWGTPTVDIQCWALLQSWKTRDNSIHTGGCTLLINTLSNYFNSIDFFPWEIPVQDFRVFRCRFLLGSSPAWLCFRPFCLAMVELKKLKSRLVKKVEEASQSLVLLLPEGASWKKNRAPRLDNFNVTH